MPDEGSASEDRSASPSVEDKDSCLFLLQKDSERRAILYKILKEEQNKVASNLQDCIAQVISVFLFPCQQENNKPDSITPFLKTNK